MKVQQLIDQLSFISPNYDVMVKVGDSERDLITKIGNIHCVNSKINPPFGFIELETCNAIDWLRAFYNEAIPKDRYEAQLKKGKWIAHRKSNGEVGYFQCTSCNHHSVVKFPYCPICGAEMDCNPNILSEMNAIPRDMYETRLKADMAAMLEDLKKEINPIKECEQQIYGKESWNFVGKCQDMIQSKIEKLKEKKK